MEMMFEEGLKALENELMKPDTIVTYPNSNNNIPTTPSPVLASPVDMNKKNKGKQVENGGGESEVHIFTERERRKKMRTMFSTLHSLLPHLPPKADKSTIVDEAIKYIDILEKNLQQVQKQRLNKKCQATTPAITELGPPPLNMPQPEIKTCFQTWFSPNVVINVCGNDAQISLCTTKRPVGFLTNIVYILNKHKIEILNAHITSNHNRTIYMIHAHHAGTGASDQFSVEDTFRLAVGEVIFFLFPSV